MKHLVWKSFLTIYVLLLFFHVFELQPDINVVPFLFAGLLLAVIAHRKNHWSSIPFLVLHMVLEAIEFGSQGFLVGFTAVWFLIVHVGMDVVFLWGEIKRHFFAARYILFSSIILAIASIYLFIPQLQTRAHSALEQFHGQIELFVVGGVIGCVLSHLIPHTHKKHTV